MWIAGWLWSQCKGNWPHLNLILGTPSNFAFLGSHHFMYDIKSAASDLTSIVSVSSHPPYWGHHSHNSCPLRQWWYPTIASSVALFSSCWPWNLSFTRNTEIFLLFWDCPLGGAIYSSLSLPGPAGLPSPKARPLFFPGQPALSASTEQRSSFPALAGAALF